MKNDTPAIRAGVSFFLPSEPVGDMHRYLRGGPKRLPAAPLLIPTLLFLDSL